MMKKIWCLCFCFVMALPLFSTKIVPLPGHLKPFRIRIEGNHFYITEGPKIYIYSLQDYGLKKTFGKAGEGPQEFKLPPEFSTRLDFQNHTILVSSVGKVSFFKTNGEFIKEKRAQHMNLINMHRLLGSRIVGERLIQDKGIRYMALNLYDGELNMIKEFHRHQFYLQRGQRFNPVTRGLYLPNFYTQNLKIIVGGEINSGTFWIYNQQGDLEKKLKPRLNKVKFTEKDKQSWIDSYMTNYEYKSQYNRIKHRFQYPKYFPLFQNFVVANSRIYVQTFKRNDQDKKNEFMILNMEGKILNRVWLPLAEYFDFTPSPYTIKNDTLYQILENEESEEWELHITKIPASQ